MLTSATATWITTMTMKAIAIVQERRRLDKAVEDVPEGTLGAEDGRKLSGQPVLRRGIYSRPKRASAGRVFMVATSGTGFNRRDKRCDLDSPPPKCIKVCQKPGDAPARCVSPA